MRVSIERILWLREELSKINRERLEDIEFLKNGIVVAISKEALDKFSLTGLSNVDFITSEYYKRHPTNA